MDDAFELFLWPEDVVKEKRDGYQFIVNSKGVMMDLHKNSGWQSHADVAAHVDEGVWSCEIRVPYTDLNVAPPTSGTVWRANFCRDWWRPAIYKNPAYSAWDFSGAGFIDGQGILRFGEPSVRVELGGGLPQGQLRIAAVNPGKSAWDLQVEAKSGEEVLLRETKPVASGATVGCEKAFSDVADGILTVTAAAGEEPVFLYGVRFSANPPMEVSCVPDIEHSRMVIKANLRGLDAKRSAALPNGGDIYAEVRIHGDVVDQQTVRADSFNLEWAVPMNWTAKEMSIDVSLSLALPGFDPVTAEKHLDKPETPWLGTHVGVSSEVLAPWTPLVVEQPGVIDCWGRTCDLRGLLPRSMVNKGVEQLAAPIRVVIDTDQGREIVAGELVPRAVEASPGRYDYTVETAIQGGQAISRGFMEYDGLSSMRLSFVPPPEGWNVKRLSIEIPLRRDLVKYIRTPRRQEWDGRQWNSTFTPYIWIGTEDEGFCMFVDSDANWLADAHTPAVSLTVSEDGAMLRLTMISTPSQVSKPLDYLIGFMSTPVKPMMKGWRNFNNHGEKKLALQNVHNWGVSARVHWAFPLEESPEAMQSYLDRRRAAGTLEMQYVPAQLTAPSATYSFFESIWNNPYKTTDANTRSICQASSFTDYLTWSIDRILRTYGENSIYTDVDRLIPCDNRLHGCGYVDAFGRSGPTYHILERRAFYKRLLTIARSHHTSFGPGVLMCHAHDNLVLPYHSFADLFYPGEQFAGPLYHNLYFYIKDLDPVSWRCELSGKASGIPHIFLPQFERGSGSKEDVNVPGPSQSLHAVTLLNDIQCDGNWMNDESVEELWELRRVTGLNRDDIRFIAYWRPDSPAQAVTEQAVCSVYLIEAGHVCLAIANLAPEDHEITVHVDLKALGLADGTVEARDERAGQSVAVSGNRLTLPVKGYNYGLVTLKLTSER